jgi:ABC-type Fe3+ transport system substrate-binding protein
MFAEKSLVRPIVTCLPKTLLAICCGVAIGLVAAARCDAAAAPGSNKLLDVVVDGAKKEGEAIVRMPSDLAAKEGFGAAIQKGIAAKWGLNLKIRVTGTRGMDQDIATTISEIEAGRQPSWDVVTGTAPTLFRLKERNGIEPVEWSKTFSHITPKMVESTVSALPLSVNWYLPYYNTRTISKEDLANLPTKWEDFLHPRWKGKLIHPLGTRQEVLLARVWGDQKTTDFVRKLAAQDLLIARFPEARSRLFSGERPMVYFGDYPIWHNLAQSAGAPVKPIIGLNPQPTVYFLQAITKGARSPNIAKIVLAYMATPEAQNLIYELVQYGSPFVPGSPIEKIYQELESKGSKMVTFGDLEEDERRNREYNKLLGF